MSANLNYKPGPLPNPTANGQQLNIQTSDSAGKPLGTITYTAKGYTNAETGETIYRWEALIRSSFYGGVVAGPASQWALVPPTTEGTTPTGTTETTTAPAPAPTV